MIEQRRVCVCDVCGWAWLPLVPVEQAKRCAHCKSRQWNSGKPKPETYPGKLVTPAGNPTNPAVRELSAKITAKIAQATEELPHKACRSCEGALVFAKGKWACPDVSCSRYGLEQK